MGMLGYSSTMLVVVLLSDRPAIQIEPESSAPVRLEEIKKSSAPAGHVQPSVRLEQSAVLDKLRLQSAMRSAKELLADQRFTDAIATLESCLDQTSAPPELLMLLEQCYRGRMAELVASGSSREASMVAERLRAMAGSAGNSGRGWMDRFLPARAEADSLPAQVDKESLPTTTPPSALKTLQMPVQAASKMGKQMVDSVKSIIPRTKPAETMQVRAKLDDGESLTPTSEIDRAQALFAEKRYPEALTAFEKLAADPQIDTKPIEVRWGYCLLVVTIKRYNDLLDGDWKSIEAGVWEELKGDVQRAYDLAPRIHYCQKVIDALEARVQFARQQPRAAASPNATIENSQAYGLVSSKIEEPTQAVRHLNQAAGSWQIAETRNFIIYHRDRPLAEDVGARAEKARQYAIELWFGNDPASDWQPKCELYLYPSSQEYSMATGVPAESPGHSKVLNQSGQIQSRQVFLRMDDPSAQKAVLPHEVAHVVFAGRFGSSTVPRWADEGMAVLTEPLDMQNAHLKNLARCYATGAGFSCAQVMTMGEYPPGERMRDFYAHSVGICRNLVEKHGHAKLIAFLRRALETGNYETSLQEVLGKQSFSELEGEFRQFVGNIAPTGPLSMAR
ncbi:hypothetical protein K2X85_10645 [bacterium]|nr:hypothetical protein [bacterium]